ncbi:MAG TPA: class I SAM-dependent methyltransferase [Alphaproteobacteria bacterium]|nr:class I SAM-dependent methyltransferase [Alphaproteobacteria bacterium]HQS94770.1 class I SAM-dependent methyltransferase [Alphaproteobacteria bacterium]
MNHNSSNSDPSLRFKFGKNWSNFLKTLTPERIKEAEESLLASLNKKDLTGLRFLDIGSGSGLFSLSARRLGAEVYSFDYDKDSVACTQYLKETYFPKDSLWSVQQGSALDLSYLKTLGIFDIVYSWGVLHHTGHMMDAFENVSDLVKPNGFLFISIYNDQGRVSKRWTWIKKLYNQSGFFVKFLLTTYTLFRTWSMTCLRDFLRTGNPFKTWINWKKNRGMSAYYDLIDWVGGYPFEVATPELVFNFFKKKGFLLESLKTCGGGIGCNEYIFKKI